MLWFLERKSSLGIEITGSEIRLAGVMAAGEGLTVDFSGNVPLAPGMVSSNYGLPNVLDGQGVAGVLRDCLSRAGQPFRRAALSLPDSVFRVQTLEFDGLPSNPSERDRLIRWRLEKTAAYDLSDAVLRSQVLKREANGFTVLACTAKKAVIEQYEQTLIDVGLEPWRVGPSSFHARSFYLPILLKKTPVFAFVYLTEDSFAALVSERGGTRFYRFKDVKRGGTDDIKARFMREIEDSLHFYSHMDRTQTSELKSLFLCGESDLPRELADGLSSHTGLSVEVLSPADVITGMRQSGGEPSRLFSLTASLGAGRAL